MSLEGSLRSSRLMSGECCEAVEVWNVSLPHCQLTTSAHLSTPHTQVFVTRWLCPMCVCVFAVPDVLPRSYTLPLYFTPEDMEHLSGTAAISENSHLHHHSFVINHFVGSLFECTLLSRFFHQSKPSVLTRSALLSVSMPTCTAS